MQRPIHLAGDDFRGAEGGGGAVFGLDDDKMIRPQGGGIAEGGVRVCGNQAIFPVHKGEAKGGKVSRGCGKHAGTCKHHGAYFSAIVMLEGRRKCALEKDTPIRRESMELIGREKPTPEIMPRTD